MRNFLIAALAISIFAATPAFAKCGNDLAYKKLDELPTFSGAPAAGDLVGVCDTSENRVEKMDLSAGIFGGAFNGTVGATTPSTGAFTQIDNTTAPTANHATTKYSEKILYTVPIHTTGSNTDFALSINPTISNATGGTNIFGGLRLEAITGDAQVSETAVSIGSGYDTALNADGPVTVTGALTASGDIIGDGGDQIYGYLQDQVASTTVSATIAQCGKTFVNDSADVISLPEASTALGCRYTFVCGNASNFDINPADGTDQIGLVFSITGANTTTAITPSAGDAIRCAAVGASIQLEAVGANLWVSVGNANGTWTDVN